MPVPNVLEPGHISLTCAGTGVASLAAPRRLRLPAPLRIAVSHRNLPRPCRPTLHPQAAAHGRPAHATPAPAVSARRQPRDAGRRRPAPRGASPGAAPVRHPAPSLGKALAAHRPQPRPGRLDRPGPRPAPVPRHFSRPPAPSGLDGGCGSARPPAERCDPCCRCRRLFDRPCHGAAAAARAAPRGLSAPSRPCSRPNVACATRAAGQAWPLAGPKSRPAHRGASTGLLSVFRLPSPLVRAAVPSARPAWHVYLFSPAVAVQGLASSVCGENAIRTLHFVLRPMLLIMRPLQRGRLAALALSSCIICCANAQTGEHDCALELVFRALL